MTSISQKKKVSISQETDSPLTSREESSPTTPPLPSPTTPPLPSPTTPPLPLPTTHFPSAPPPPSPPPLPGTRRTASDSRRHYVHSPPRPHSKPSFTSTWLSRFRYSASQSVGKSTYSRLLMSTLLSVRLSYPAVPFPAPTPPSAALPPPRPTSHRLSSPTIVTTRSRIISRACACPRRTSDSSSRTVAGVPLVLCPRTYW